MGVGAHMKDRRKLYPWAVGTLAALAGAHVYRRFRADLRAAWGRIEAGGCVTETTHGEIEYGEAGDGFPVLVIHGAGGGYDHSLLVGQFILGDDYRVIAVSRFGYLRSPAPADANPQAQADLLASLLDQLGVERAAVAAFSAGGPTGIQFALRHPVRTAALVLVSAISCVPTAEGEPWRQRAGAPRTVASEFVYWLGLRGAQSRLLASLGVSKEMQASWSEEERAQVDRILDAMLPFNARSDGYLLDRALVVSPDVPLERVQAPTLVIHARDDTVVDWANGQQAAARIPGASSLFFEQGGHLLLGQHVEVRAGVVSFLKRVLSQPEGMQAKR
jgi:pimeloyl-ACP methyl ester carboxylesterase